VLYKALLNRAYPNNITPKAQMLQHPPYKSDSAKDIRLPHK